MLFLVLQQRNWAATRLSQLFSQQLPSSVKADAVELTAILDIEDHRVFMIDSCGFKQLAQDPIIHIAQGVYPEYGDPFDSFDTLNHRWASDTVLETIRMNWYYLEMCKMVDSPGLIYQRLREFK